MAATGGGWVIDESRSSSRGASQRRETISGEDVSLGVSEFAGRIDVSSGTLPIGGLVLDDVGGVDGQSAAVYVRRVRADGPVGRIAEIRIVVGEDVLPQSDPLWFAPKARDDP
jgi:hypothetical protein